MSERVERSAMSILEEMAATSGKRLDEERAKRILERAAALDAERSSEIELAQLREAATSAGISPEAFDQAMREDEDGESAETDDGDGGALVRRPGRSEVTHYAALLKDLLGDEAQITVVEDRIEGRMDDGVTVSINTSSGEAAAAIVADGSLKRRLMVLGASAIPPWFFGFLLALEEEAPGVGWMLGVIVTAVAAGIGLFVSHRREKKELEGKADRVRRQLQRMITKDV